MGRLPQRGVWERDLQVDQPQPSVLSEQKLTFEIGMVVRGRNVESDLRRLVVELREQQGARLHVVFVDNESVDQSRQVARSAGWKIVSISDKEWSWGAAINMGVAAIKARVDWISVWSADVSPGDSTVLRDLARRLIDDPGLAAVYARQVPRPSASLIECVRLASQFGGDSQRLSGEPGTVDLDAFPASNACALYRQACVNDLPFEVGQPAEEIAWCKGALKRGWSIQFESNICVYHSHDDTVRREVLRACDINLAIVTKGSSRLKRACKLFGVAIRHPLRVLMLAARESRLASKTRVYGAVRGFAVGAGICTVGALIALGVDFERLRRSGW